MTGQKSEQINREQFYMARGKTLTCALALSTVLAAQPALAGGWKTVAEVGRAGLVAAAFGGAAVQEDWNGVLQATYSIGITAGTTYALKETFPENRPNGEGDDSFPSGHTSISFASAAFIHQRYGWQYGLPAYAVAATVGVARIESDHHHWYDVAVGAALGTATAFLFSTKFDDTVQLFPWGDTNGGGLAMNVRF